MVEAVSTAVGIALLASSLWFGHRAVTAGTLYRSVSASGDDSPSTLVDGETVATEGTVNVVDPPPLSDSLPTDEARSVGAYVWRLTDSENHQYTVAPDGDGRSDTNRITYASGIESGTFTVDDGRREIRVDTDWLAETHDSADITTVSREWRLSTVLSKRSWASPYLHLDDHQVVHPVADLDDVFDTDAGETPDGEFFEASAVLDGETLAVHGDVTVDRDTPVLRGSDQTPLALSDQGFDAFGASLRRQTLTYGLAAGGSVASAGLALANGLVV